MQEKIHLGPPPEIKIFGGKPPPTSWVNENIVQYYNLRSSIDFLSDLVNYLHDIQGKMLAQTRPSPLMAREEYLPFPEKGTASDISTALTFNSTQSYLKTVIDFSAKFIQILKPGASPALRAALEEDLAALKNLAGSFPRLSQAQTTELNGLLEKAVQYAKDLPFSSKRAFWNSLLFMMQSLMGENGRNIKDFQNEINELKARSKYLSSLQEMLDEVQTLLRSKPPSAGMLLKLMETLQKLANSAQQLTPDQQQLLSSFFQQLQSVKTAGGKSLTETVADTLLQNKLADFLKEKPNATPAEIKEHLKKFLKESNLQSSPLHFMKEWGDLIEDLLDKKEFPHTEGHLGEALAIQKEGRVFSNEKSMAAILSQFAPDEESLNRLGSSSDTFKKNLSEEITGNGVKIEGYSAALDQLKDIQNHLGKGAMWSVGQSLATGRPPAGAGFGSAAPGAPAAGASGALPWQFEHAILGHYMPNQEAYLQSLAMFLFLDNMGAQFGNTLLTDMLDFGEAADNFNFANGLHGADDKGNFQGSYSSMKAQLSAEKNKIGEEINKTKEAMAHIQSMIAKIRAELNKPGLSPSQRNLLEKQEQGLEGIGGQLKVCLEQENNLKSILDQIKISKPTGKDQTPSKYCNISGPTGWQTTLGQDENYVVNGNPKSQPNGGLVNVQALTQNFQQTYSDQSQNMQMILEMRMTEIQQEWTVVSTALQSLNQMYMQLSQAIYK